MKICILHLSDFHVHEGEYFLREKINKFLDSLNILGSVDEYTIVFSGDLANSGKINEYKNSRFIFRNIINGIKPKHNDKFVKLYMVPGNHDLSLPKDARTRRDIHDAYKNNLIESLLPNEIALLKNYYEHSHANVYRCFDKTLDRQFCKYNNKYTIQFNLINTSLFSTLEPNDKEIHYFHPKNMSLLKKRDDVNLCITVMHHGCEWFYWDYKYDLEKAIINNSEILLTGHDHYGNTKKISIDNSMDIWMSCAGEMKFSDINYQDSFNAILIDTENNTLCGYIFTWDSNGRIYVHNKIASDERLQRRTGQIMPLQSYVQELKEDTYNDSNDFTKYFVFPKLICAQKNEFGKHIKVTTIEELIEFIKSRKRVLISGSSNSGKTTLFKYLYCSICGDKVPLYLAIDSATKINQKQFIKRLFEKQYGEDSILYEKYQQLEKNQKMLIVDGWDFLDTSKADKFFSILEENFNYIILGVSDTQQSIADSVKDEIDKNHSLYELQITPFFTEKRNQLVRNICTLKSSYSDGEIDKINQVIDSLVNNNSSLFSLNPGFIIRYTNYFIKDQTYDYAKGEATFSKIFEFGIQNSIIKITKKSDVDEIFTVFEEIAGHIYNTHKDILKIEEFRSVIETYNEDYSNKINVKNVLSIGLQSKILRQTDDLSVYFANKNYLAYFIAKYLLRLLQTEENFKGINDALHNICFGINSDIILFISYLTSNTKIVMLISEKAGELLSPWEELSFEKNNISLIRTANQNKILAPTKEDIRRMKEKKELREEANYKDETIEAKGLFEYNEDDIDKPPFQLVRARKYTEMICKALPALNNVLKREQKETIIEAIYSYPHKIVFAHLKPLDDCVDELCEELLKLAKKLGEEKKTGRPYTKDDVLDMINNHARAFVLSSYNHFAELCTSSKTIRVIAD